jgi:anti-sigma regulatory factor (Ser/Thr protein kinase)
LLDSVASLEVELPVGVEAPGQAREALAPILRALDEERRFRIELLTSELVTNAVRHSRGWVTDPIRVRASAPGECLRIEVSDPGRSDDELIRPIEPRRGENASGYGLWLLDRLADTWGVDRSHGTTVWFEMREPASVKKSA